MNANEKAQTPTISDRLREVARRLEWEAEIERCEAQIAQRRVDLALHF